MRKKSFFAVLVAGIVLSGVLLNALFFHPKESLRFMLSDKVEGKFLWGYMDEAGHKVIPPRFISAYNFSDGLAAVQTDSGWGFIDISGNFVIQPQFKGAYLFQEGLADVSLDGRTWGYVDGKGKFIIEPEFESTYPFHNGLAEVRVGNKSGLINKKGEFEVRPNTQDCFGQIMVWLP
jgi:hypothetical protein